MDNDWQLAVRNTHRQSKNGVLEYQKPL